jgi:hypothetical protein
MCPQEVEGASRGEWVDGPFVVGDRNESGKKWLWTSPGDAKSWAEFLRSNGETGNVIADVATLKPLAEYPSFEHPPQGPAVHVPISDLGPATEYSD